MRPGKGCKNCRERHLKCVVRDGQSSCTRCAESDRKCNFEPRFRFKRVSHVDTASAGNRSRTSLSYKDDQTWVQTQNPVSFVLEDGSGVDGDATELDVLDVEDDANDFTQYSANLASQDGGPHSSEALAGATFDYGNHPRDTSDEKPWQSPYVLQRSHGAAFAVDLSSPASIAELAKRHDDASYGGHSAAAPETPFAGSGSAVTSPADSLPTPGAAGGVPPIPKPSRREAFLLQHFVEKLAPWVLINAITSLLLADSN